MITNRYGNGISHSATQLTLQLMIKFIVILKPTQACFASQSCCPPASTGCSPAAPSCPSPSSSEGEMKFLQKFNNYHAGIQLSIQLIYRWMRCI
ncbi:unnamed protein product [Cercopithifilaria johnstoni]|uniref:Uncharacterized protein n=1 Tax=Cercopithifilaria johnstoni TaxID=2874296 RepID=A0A8J2MC18_9BILA|nr:unnamed protein product [Cercopithifilaria johnstoni]